MRKIADNPSSKELLEQINAFNVFVPVCRRLPLLGRLIPKDIEEKLESLMKQAEFLSLPDRFNDIFRGYGWIAYESMDVPVMREAIEKEASEGIDAGEECLVSYYNEETLKWGILRFHGHPEFRRRIRLTELARDDYLAGRYHSCVPLLLSLTDGIVNDVSKQVGLFADGADMTAWDSVVAHESGLGALLKVIGIGRNRTNEDPITIPYRHGILHGRELAFDNQLVAAKCWGLIFAVRDWADAVTKDQNTDADKQKPTFVSSLKMMKESADLRRAFEEWRPRSPEMLTHLPTSGPFENIPAGLPERTAAEFLDHWIKGRYGPMAELLLDFSDTPLGRKAGHVKEAFRNRKLESYRIIGLKDDAASAKAKIQATFKIDESTRSESELEMRLLCVDQNSQPKVQGSNDAKWVIVEGSLSCRACPGVA